MTAIKRERRVDVEAEAYEALKGEYRHFCPAWDYMAIDEGCPEFGVCSCQFRDAGRADEIRLSMCADAES